MRCQARQCKRTANTTGMQTACAACHSHACNITVALPRSCYIRNAMLTMAGCRPLQTASSEVVSPRSRNAAFEDRRCLETPLCARHASRRSVEACRCLLYIFILEAQSSRLEAGDGMWPARNLALASLSTLPKLAYWPQGLHPPASRRSNLLLPPRWPLQNPVQCTGKVAPDSAGESYEPETAAAYHRRGSDGGPAPRQIDAQLLPLAHLRGVGESTRRSSTSHHAENRI